MKVLLYPFIGLSLAGLAASFIVHVLAVLGVELPGVVMGLHLGVFLVFFPAVIASHRFQPPRLGLFHYRDQLRGSPLWMRLSAYGLFAYAFANFFLAVSGGSTLRGFSGGWMAFYGFACVMLYAALQRHAERRCLAGHPVSETARYCEKCGQPIIEN